MEAKENKENVWMAARIIIAAVNMTLPEEHKEHFRKFTKEELKEYVLNYYSLSEDKFEEVFEQIKNCLSGYITKGIVTAYHIPH